MSYDVVVMDVIKRMHDVVEGLVSSGWRVCDRGDGYVRLTIERPSGVHRYKEVEYNGDVDVITINGEEVGS